MATADEVIEFLQLHIALDESCRTWIRSSDFRAQYLPLRRRFVGLDLEQRPMSRTSYSCKTRLVKGFKESMRIMSNYLSETLFQFINWKSNKGKDEQILDSFVECLFQFLIHNALRTSDYYRMALTDVEKAWIGVGVASYTSARSKYAFWCSSSKSDITFNTSEPLAANAMRKTLKKLSKMFPDRVSPALCTKEATVDNAIASIISQGQAGAVDRTKLEWATVLALIRFNNVLFTELPFLDQDIVKCIPKLRGQRLRCNMLMTKKELFAMLLHNSALGAESDPNTDQFFWDTLRSEKYRHLLFGIVFSPSQSAHPDGILVCPLGDDGKKYILILIGCKALSMKKSDGLNNPTIQTAAQTDPALLYRTGILEKPSQVWLKNLNAAQKLEMPFSISDTWWWNSKMSYQSLVDNPRVPVVSLLACITSTVTHLKRRKC